MRFKLKVYSESAGVLELQADAGSVEEASRDAVAQGHIVLSVSSSGWQLGWPAQMRAGGRSRFPLLLFSQQLLSLLEAGLNLVEAIETLAENESDTRERTVMRRLLEHLYGGRTCSDAMEAMPEHFPPFYVATLRASERSGGTAESLRRYIGYQTQIDFVKKRMTSAMIYPVLLLFVGGLVTLFLLGYVVPKFSSIYEQRATDLPFLSRALMHWGGLVAGHGGKLLAALALGLVVMVWAAMHPAVRQWIGRRLWATPWLGERMRIYQFSRLYRTLGMLLRGGTTITGALGLVRGLLSPVLRGRLAIAESRVREGQSISVAMLEAGLTTPVAGRMLQVGWRTGRMGEMMERVAAFYDDEIARWLDVFTKVFEPVLMILIGALVGGIVILMYLPIFELAGSIQS
jgi:general secretion pathway protein F